MKPQKDKERSDRRSWKWAVGIGRRKDILVPTDHYDVLALVALEPMLNYQLSQRIGPAAGPMARATGAALTQIAGAGKTKEVFLSATAGPYKKSVRKSSRWARPTR